MSSTRWSVFTDPDITPDDTLISEALGEAFFLWQRLEEELTGPNCRLTFEWSHFTNGGWVCKAKKNLAWLAVRDSYIRVTFYFRKKYVDGLVALALPEGVHDQIVEPDKPGSMLTVDVPVFAPQDIDTVHTLVGYRLSGPSIK